MAKYVPYVKTIDVYESNNAKYPFKTQYKWGVYDTERKRFMVLYTFPLFGRWRAQRTANKLNKES